MSINRKESSHIAGDIMKGNILGLLGCLILLGCLGQPANQITKEQLDAQLENITDMKEEDLISVSGNENVSIVKIKAARVGGGWQFPLENHTDRFLEFGLHSDYFVSLNNSHLKFLENDESVYLTPMIKDGNRTVLFNAIYHRDVSDRSADTVSILGKEYGVAGLATGASFGNDDKWKVSLKKDQGFVREFVIYMDGYFYDMEEGEQINLFRNDNTLLLSFKDMESTPYVEIVGTRPLE